VPYALLESAGLRAAYGLCAALVVSELFALAIARHAAPGTAALSESRRLT